jgi:hypothetical protein
MSHIHSEADGSLRLNEFLVNRQAIPRYEHCLRSRLVATRPSSVMRLRSWVYRGPLDLGDSRLQVQLSPILRETKATGPGGAGPSSRPSVTDDTVGKLRSDSLRQSLMASEQQATDFGSARCGLV